MLDKIHPDAIFQTEWLGARYQRALHRPRAWVLCTSDETGQYWEAALQAVSEISASRGT